MSLLTSSLCPLSMRFVGVFFFSDTLQFFLHFAKHFQCLTSEQSLLPSMNTNYQQKWIKLLFQLSSVVAKWAAFKHAPECEGRWPEQPIYHVHLVLQWGIIHSASRLFVQVFFRYCQYSSIPLICLKNQENRHRQRWAVFKMELDWNWTLSLNSWLIFFTFHFSLFFWHHCNNSPLAGTLCCLCVLWVMWCNPKWSSSTTKKKGYEHEHLTLVQ